MNAAATFAVMFAALWTGHQAGDDWVQTSRQALPGWPGRRACAAHVATLAAAKAACVVLAIAVTGMPVAAWQVAAGLALDAASHWWADRRLTLHAGRPPRQGSFWTLGQPREGHDDNPGLGTGASLIIGDGAR
jgi:hypothetical protein